MLRKIVSASLALALLSGCAVSPEDYKVGKDYYDIDVQGFINQPNAKIMKHWTDQMCPQGHRVVSAKLDRMTPGPAQGMHWWDVTIACPAR